MYNCLAKARKHLKKLDVFGSPIHLNIDGKSSYQSALGGFMTFSMIICIGVILYFQVLVFLSKSNIYVSVRQVFSQDPKLVELNHTNIMFVIGIEQLNTSSFSERPFYNVTITQNIINQTTNEKKIIEIPLQPCKIERFKQFQEEEAIEIDMGEIFVQSHFERYLCLPSDFSMNLKGAFLSQDFQYVQIKVTKCKNDTNNAYWNPICAPPEEVKQYLIQNNALRFTLYTTNYVVNPEKAINSTQIYMSQDLTYLFQPDVLVKQVNVNFRNYELLTDESLYVTAQNVSKTYNYREQTSSSVQTQQNLLLVYKDQLPPQELDLYKSALTINLKSDYFSVEADRKFMKIDALFSYFGGIFNSLNLLIGIFMIQYNYCFFKLRLVNRLYDFNEPKNHKTHHEQGSKMQNGDDSFHDDAQLSDVTSEQKIRQMGFQSKSEFLFWYLEKVIQQKQKLKLTFGYIIFTLSCGRYHHNNNNIIIDSAFTKIDADMNIKEILNKVNQVDKLKRLILTKQQIVLFNFFPKPSFHSQNKKSMDSTSFHRQHLNKKSTIIQVKEQNKVQVHGDFDNFHLLLKAFDIITKTVSSDETTVEINKKLIFLLGYELRSMFKASLLIEEQDLIEQGATALKECMNLKNENVVLSLQLSKIKSDDDTENEKGHHKFMPL